MYEYKTSGTCASKIHFDLEGGKVYSVSFENGCDGNLKALSNLTEGMEATEVIRRLKGIRCDQKKTSCGDQLANAIEQHISASQA